MSRLGIAHSAPSMTPRSSDGTMSPPGHPDRADPHPLEHLQPDPRRAELELLQVLEVVHRLLEPAEGLPERLNGREVRDHVHLQLFLQEVVVELLAAAGEQPGGELVLAHPERPAERGAEEPGRGVLAGPESRPREPAVERAAVHRVQHLEESHHGADRERLDLEPAARHLVDRLGDLHEGAMRIVRDREGALHLPGERPRLGGRRGRGQRREDGHEGDDHRGHHEPLTLVHHLLLRHGTG